MTINLFVYGTLRPGDYNYPAISGAVEADPVNGVVKGKLYHVSPRNRVYPVAKLDEEGEIFGTVLVVNERSYAYQSTKAMEENAGYEAVRVPCRLADGSEIEVTAFHYCHEPRGPEIASGDWYSPEAELV